MRVIDAGHKYNLRQLDSSSEQMLTFVRRGLDGGEKYAGVNNQEVIRALIDRVEFLDKEKPWTGNVDILYHLRMALVLHEARALIIKTNKGTILPEHIMVSVDGHFKLEKDN